MAQAWEPYSLKPPLEYLQDLAEHNRHQRPGNMDWDLEGLSEGDQIEKFAEYLQFYAQLHPDPELFAHLEPVYDMNLYCIDWVYLRGATQEEHEWMVGWVSFVVEDLQCDEHAVMMLTQVMRRNPPGVEVGLQEANRILAHILKDKWKPAAEGHDGQDWSAFVSSSCEEVLEALERPDLVLSLEPKTRRGRAGGAMPSRQYFENLKGDGKGKGKGKGGGKFMDHCKGGGKWGGGMFGHLKGDGAGGWGDWKQVNGFRD